MKNKVKLKKFLLCSSLIFACFLIIFWVINILEYHTYTKNFNKKILSITSCIKEKYPNISENEIMYILNSDNVNDDMFKKYNIDIKLDSIVLKNDKNHLKFIIINSIFFTSSVIVFMVLFLKFNHKKDIEINNITKYIEEINKKNYTLQIDDISEDELSILKNEIYKTTVMLKEQAENLGKDKNDLKKSLSDISHQLKTPITSILIILDNLLEDEGMDKNTRQDFILDIKREINNINFLVQNLLKLSKLDTNTVKFVNEDVSAEKIVKEAIKKVSVLCDLKDININLCVKENTIIKVDENWQIEAISNIIKNSLEHSNNGGSIDITIDKNKLYSEIIIKDYGIGIDTYDLPHIFERFYKGKSAKADSIGIGLALSKSIIDASNGKIIVESKINEGTKFIIRYYSN